MRLLTIAGFTCGIRGLTKSANRLFAAASSLPQTAIERSRAVHAKPSGAGALLSEWVLDRYAGRREMPDIPRRGDQQIDPVVTEARAESSPSAGDVCSHRQDSIGINLKASFEPSEQCFRKRRFQPPLTFDTAFDLAQRDGGQKK